jgi:hypothetical protein
VRSSYQIAFTIGAVNDATLGVNPSFWWQSIQQQLVAAQHERRRRHHRLPATIIARDPRLPERI